MTELITRLRKTNSIIEKEHILKSADDIDKRVFKAAYNQDVSYGLHYDYVEPTVGFASLEMFDILYGLASRQLTGNKARDVVNKFAKENGSLIQLICNKDLDCGVSVATLERAFGKGFVPKFKVQLAEEANLDKVHFPVIGQIKYNGVRITALVSKHGVELKTRNGKLVPFPRLQIVLEELVKLNNGLEFMLDGELVVGDSSNVNHTSISGTVNSAIRGTPITGAGINYVVFDAMHLSQFYAQDCPEPFLKRRTLAMSLVDSLDDVAIKNADTWFCESREQVEEVFKDCVSLGFEGLILKPFNHLYKFKRTKDWLKMKTWKSVDLECVGYQEGTGKYEGMIGSLTCVGVAEGQAIEVEVASGLTDAYRAASPTSYIGKTIEVFYNEVIENKRRDGYTLFLPVFEKVRFDK